MLLRRADPHDEDLFMSMTFQREIGDTAPQPPTGDPLDDVFGSGPSSPALEPQDDSLSGTARTSALHPSDVPRLQQEHTTAGYRDGITAAKSGSVQAGFDEGFSLGATIGLRAGELLGILEGMAGAVGGILEGMAGAVGDARSAASEGQGDTSPSALLVSAREELSVKSIYGADYWNPDGTWKYDVQAADGSEGGVIFPDVADSHPLLRKWAAVVDTEVSRWGINRSVLQGEDASRLDITTQVPAKSQDAESKTRTALDW